MYPKLMVNSHPAASLILSSTVMTSVHHHAQHGQHPDSSGHALEEQMVMPGTVWWHKAGIPALGYWRQ